MASTLKQSKIITASILDLTKKVRSKAFSVSILFMSIIILILSNSRPARDDWSNWSNLRSLSLLDIESWRAIATNSWCCQHEKRIFFISWLVQWPLSKIGFLAIPFIYLLILFLFYLIFLSLKQLVFIYTKDKFFAVFVSLIVTFSPISVVVGFWPNNLFFLIPATFSLLLAVKLSEPRLRRVVVVVLAFVSVFSGESAIIFVVLLIFIAAIYRRKQGDDKFLASLGVTIIFSIFVYREFIAVGPDENRSQISIQKIYQYFLGFKSQFFQLWNVNSSAYKLEQVFSLRFLLLLILLYSICVTLISRERKSFKFHNAKFDKKIKKLMSLVVLYLSCLGPLIIGAALGTREGSNYRYHLLPFVGISLLISAVLFSLFRSQRLRMILLLPILSYSLFMGSLALETRFKQGEMDAAIWDRLVELNGRLPEVVVTHSPFTSYLMPPYFSFAESDFQADWGIAGYVFWNSSQRPMVFRSLACVGSECTATTYYGEKIVLPETVLLKTVFMYTSKEIEPRKLNVDDFYITKSYESYKRFSEKYPQVFLPKN